MSTSAARCYRCSCGELLLTGGASAVRFPSEWTDGFRTHSHQQPSTQVLMCAACRGFVWLECADPHQTIENPLQDYPDYQSLRGASVASVPTLADYRCALEFAPSPNAESHVRLKIWRLGNMGFRVDDPEGAHSAEAVANMERLLELGEVLGTSDRLHVAELLRELGRCIPAIEALENYRDEDPARVVRAVAILRAAREEDVLPRRFELPPGGRGSTLVESNASEAGGPA